jgi:electron transfer flavoprotein alpha subunit
VIAPQLYLAVGISGQVQHMVGARGAKLVVAVNSDANAPIFGECDLGVVGDLYQVVPELIQALSGV